MAESLLYVLMTGFDGKYELLSEVPADEFDVVQGAVWISVGGRLLGEPVTLQSVLTRMPDAEWVEVESGTTRTSTS